MRLSSLTLFLLLSTPMLAQTPAERRLIDALHPANNSCPVGFWATRQGSWGLESTKTANGVPRQGMDLSFRAGERRVVEADITARGWTNQLRVVPAAYPEETTESFVLNGTNDAPLEQELVWMKRLGVVNSVELTRLVFSDGTTWTPTGNAHCTVTPSKLLRVNASPQPK